MSSLRHMKPADLLGFANCNLDPLTETYNIAFYLEYLAKWPYLCFVIESRQGQIEGYCASSPFLRSRTLFLMNMDERVPDKSTQHEHYVHNTRETHSNVL